jgi:hypothetical protein
MYCDAEGVELQSGRIMDSVFFMSASGDANFGSYR